MTCARCDIAAPIKALPCRLQATNISNHYHLDLYLEIEWPGVPFLSAMNLSGGLLCRRLSMPRGEYSGKIATLRPHLLDFLRLDEPAPRHALTLAEWSQPIALRPCWPPSDHIYRHQPTLPREQKPLLSLWAQWYIGLLVPPLMLALLNEPQGLSPRQNISMSNFMKAAGRPASGLMCIAMPTSRGFHRRREWMPRNAHPAAGC